MTNGGKCDILCKVFSFTDIRGHPREDIQMFEKNLHLTVLFDLYGELLTEAQSKMFDYYYNDDLSLSEIAENTGITRQGVRDSIKRAEDALLIFERKLGLAEKLERISRKSEEAETLLHSLKSKYPEASADIDHVAEIFGSISL